jgi:transposase
VIHDGARYHTSAAMTHFFDAHADRLTIEPLPSYSPDFNPIEQGAFGDSYGPTETFL